MATKLAKKEWKPGELVRVVSRTYGEVQATIKSVRQAYGYYRVEIAGKERVVNERFISEVQA